MPIEQRPWCSGSVQPNLSCMLRLEVADFGAIISGGACRIDFFALCYPPAALFVFCLALLASNAVAVIKAALRAAHGAEETDELSGYYMALEIKQVHEGMMIALPPTNWEVFAEMSASTFAKLLTQIAEHV